MPDSPPTDDDLRARIAAILDDTTGLADAVMAVVTPELERLRGELAEAQAANTNGQWALDVERKWVQLHGRRAERYRLAWQSARSRAKAYGQSMTRLAAALGGAEAERDKFCGAFTDANRRATEAETAIDDTLWRMHQLRSWAHRELSGETQHHVLAVITNVWDILDPDRTRRPAMDAPETATQATTAQEGPR